jgi:hypothetical protein
MRKRTITASHKDADRRELAAALARYAGSIKRYPPRSTGGSNKRQPPKPRTDRR